MPSKDVFQCSKAKFASCSSLDCEKAENYNLGSGQRNLTDFHWGQRQLMKLLLHVFFSAKLTV